MLIVDDEGALRAACRHLLTEEGFEVAEAERGEEALAKLGVFAPHVIITDLRMPGMSGLDLLKEVKRRSPDTEVVVVTGYGTVETAVEALREGAFHFLLKPIDPFDLLAQTVRRAAERHRMARRIQELEERGSEPVASFEGMTGNGEAMGRVFRLVESISDTDAPVLVLGESGTGKDLVARAIHKRSRRGRRPFVAVNCAALQDTLLESELFGFVRGAFSGAVAEKAGLLEAADGGTLFLDEIGEMSPALQAKLLRALEDGEIRRVGGLKTHHVDVRVVAATNRKLAEDVRAGRFREDLYYRLNVFQIQLPPLRDRGDDVVVLAHVFLRKFSRGAQESFTPAALDLLRRHRWPGNVRELQNVVQYAAAVCRGEGVEVEDLPESLRSEHGGDAGGPAPYPDLLDMPYGDARLAFIAQFERIYVRHRMERSGDNLTQAARCSGMDRSNFRRLVKRAGLARD